MELVLKGRAIPMGNHEMCGSACIASAHLAAIAPCLGHSRILRGNAWDERPVESVKTKEGSQMPRHLISDAHEWINEIPTVPVYYLAKPQPRERAWKNQRGKKTLNTTHTHQLNGVNSKIERSRLDCDLLVKESD